MSHTFVKEFRDIIINPTLRKMGLYSPAASNLLLGTAVQESRLNHLKQMNNGPAIGVYQMEPATFNDIWHRYLRNRDDHLLARVDQFRGAMGEQFALRFNFPFATALARIKYFMDPKPLPDPECVGQLARYWKRVFNTPKGKGTEEEFIRNYTEYILEN